MLRGRSESPVPGLAVRAGIAIRSHQGASPIRSASPPFADAVPVVMLNQFGDPPVGAGVIADTARDEPRRFNVGVDRVHGLDIVELQRADRQP